MLLVRYRVIASLFFLLTALSLSLVGSSATIKKFQPTKNSYSHFLESKINQIVIIRGFAHNAKLGAIILTDDDIPIFIEDLPAWDEPLLQKKLKVTGILQKKCLYSIPESTKDELRAQVVEPNYILVDPTWKLDTKK